MARPKHFQYLNNMKLILFKISYELKVIVPGYDDKKTKIKKNWHWATNYFFYCILHLLLISLQIHNRALSHCNWVDPSKSELIVSSSLCANTKWMYSCICYKWFTYYYRQHLLVSFNVTNSVMMGYASRKLSLQFIHCKYVRRI